METCKERYRVGAPVFVIFSFKNVCDVAQKNRGLPDVGFEVARPIAEGAVVVVFCRSIKKQFGRFRSRPIKIFRKVFHDMYILYKFNLCWTCILMQMYTLLTEA